MVRDPLARLLMMYEVGVRLPAWTGESERSTAREIRSCRRKSDSLSSANGTHSDVSIVRATEVLSMPTTSEYVTGIEGGKRRNDCGAVCGVSSAQLRVGDRPDICIFARVRRQSVDDVEAGVAHEHHAAVRHQRARKK